MIYRSAIIGFSFLALLSFSCSCFQQSKKLTSSEKIFVKQDHFEFFSPIKIANCSSTGIPCIDITIGDVCHSMRLDLGFSGAAVLKEPFFSLVESKKFVCKESIYDLRGSEYEDDVYLIPVIQIGLLRFLDFSLRKENAN